MINALQGRMWQHAGAKPLSFCGPVSRTLMADTGILRQSMLIYDASSPPLESARVHFGTCGADRASPDWVDRTVSPSVHGASGRIRRSGRMEHARPKPVELPHSGGCQHAFSALRTRSATTEILWWPTSSWRGKLRRYEPTMIGFPPKRSVSPLRVELSGPRIGGRTRGSA